MGGSDENTHTLSLHPARKAGSRTHTRTPIASVTGDGKQGMVASKKNRPGTGTRELWNLVGPAQVPRYLPPGTLTW